jgi:hypothetical protein
MLHVADVGRKPGKNFKLQTPNFREVPNLKLKGPCWAKPQNTVWGEHGGAAQGSTPLALANLWRTLD